VNIFELGWNAFFDGIPQVDNPFFDSEFVEWNKGWQQAALRKRMMKYS